MEAEKFYTKAEKTVESKYSMEGLPVCRLCGKASADMVEHLGRHHDMSQEAYIEQYPDWPLIPMDNVMSHGTLSFKKREKSNFSVQQTFGFYWNNKKADRMVQGFHTAGPLTPKIDPSYVFNPELTRIALLALHTQDRVLTIGPTGCHEKGTPLLMFDGSIKKVEEVQIGDQLMGPDSTPRTVLELRCGQQEMYTVIPNKGTPFIVNKDHILSLIRTATVTPEGRSRGGEEQHLTRNRTELAAGGHVVDVSVADWLEWSTTQKHLHKLFRVGVEFPEQTPNTYKPIDPYILGLFLGDGCFRSSTPAIDNPDVEIRNAIFDFVKTQPNLAVTEYGISMRLVNPIGKNEHCNPLKEILKKLELWGLSSKEKFIPQQYKVASRMERLLMLAGLLDTDGSLSSNSSFDFISASKILAKDVTFIARSLGFAAYISESEKYCQTGAGGIYYRVSISGEVSEIPTRIVRKQASPRQQKKDVLRTGFTVESTGRVDEYYGFCLDGDCRYVMGDFTVTHNTGKTSLWTQIGARLNYNVVRINFDGGITRADLVGQWVVKGRDMTYQYGILPTGMTLPGTIIIIDEWDTVSDECSFVLQRPLEEESQLLLLEKGEEVISLHPDNIIVATANTNGMGDDTGLYTHGTRLQNYSQINRFSMTIIMDYLPPKEEQQILLNRFDTLEPEEAEMIITVVNTIREAFLKRTVSAPLSTRDAINWCMKYTLLGDIHKAAKYTFINRSPLEDQEVLTSIVKRAFED